MNFIKRAWLSMIRRKGKSLLLFAVIFILGNVIAGAIAIQQATQTVEKKIKSEMGSTVKVVVDYEKVIASGSETDIDSAIPEFPVSLIEQIGQSELVKYYDYSQHLVPDLEFQGLVLRGVGVGQHMEANDLIGQMVLLDLRPEGGADQKGDEEGAHLPPGEGNDLRM